MKTKGLFLAAVVVLTPLLVLNYHNTVSFAQSDEGRYLMASPNSGVYIFDTKTGSIYYAGFNAELTKVGVVPK